jgi:hypothetical protein
MERNPIYVALKEFLNTRWGEPGGQQNSIARLLGLPAEAFEKRTGDNWPDTGASLILISLLSLGLWAAIWGATSLAAVVLP